MFRQVDTYYNISTGVIIPLEVALLWIGSAVYCAASETDFV